MIVEKVKPADVCFQPITISVTIETEEEKNHFLEAGSNLHSSSLTEDITGQAASTVERLLEFIRYELLEC